MSKKIVLIVAIIVTLVLGGILCALFKPSLVQKPIKLGILHSQTGTLAADEKPLIDAELLALEEINNQGGINGVKIKPILADGKSDELVFEQEAIRLITQENVDAIIGCWSSSSRKRVKTVVEKYNNLLLYPLTYEGLEESPNIIYFGSIPNQSTIPAITWIFNNNIAQRFFLIGTDFLFSHATNKIIELHVAALGGSIVGTTYVKLGTTVTPEQIQEIIQAKPDMIINSINGESTLSFFKELLKAGITSDKIPTLSLRMTQASFQHFELQSIIGTYVLLNYAEEDPYSFNQVFLKKFRKKYGNTSKVSDPGQAAYSLLHVWAQAYSTSKSPQPELIIPAMEKIVYQSPSGIIYLSKNHHSWQDIIMSKLAYNGELIELWNSKTLIRPEPYPPYMTKDEWNQFITNLYTSWGNRWSAL